MSFCLINDRLFKSLTTEENQYVPFEFVVPAVLSVEDINRTFYFDYYYFGGVPVNF